MKQGSPESRIVNHQQEVDIGKRRLLWGAARGAAAIGAIDLLAQAEPVYANLKKVAQFRDRRKSANPPNSSSLDTQITTQDNPQGQPVTVQDTPTPDATVTALNKRKLELDVQQAQNQSNWFWLTNIAAPLGAAATIIGIGVNYIQSQNTKRLEEKKQKEIDQVDREKRDEARFQEAVLALGDQEKKLGAATTLRTFLQEEGRGYERFYQQIFDLSVGLLRLRQVDQDHPEPDPFYREIIRLFCESTPLVRKRLQKQPLSQSVVSKFENDRRKFLNASRIHLENADLINADLSFADLNLAHFEEALLTGANLSGADLDGANPEEADSLSGTKMWNVKNYSDPEKLQKCKDKGATFDPPPDQPKTTSETK